MDQVLVAILVGLASIIFYGAFKFWQLLRPLQPPRGFRPIPCPPVSSLSFEGHSTLWPRLAKADESAPVLWARQYGEIFQIRTGIYHWVFLNTPQAIKEVFDKHGGSSASKKPMPVMQDILSGGYRMLFMQYGQQWRNLRSVSHHLLTSKAAQTYKPQQDLESKRYIHDLLVQPDDFLEHVQRYTASIMMYSTYGRRVLDLKDPTLEAIYAELGGFGTIMTKWWLVEAFPVLAKIVPKSLQWWRKEPHSYHVKEVELWLGLWEGMKKQLREKGPTGCFAEGLLKTHYQQLGISETQAAYACGSLIEAGSDTTQMTLNSLILVLSAYPDVVKIAQDEIDRVVGSDRMPDFSDWTNLPYIRAMIKEILRFRATINGPWTHYTTKDIIYKDYLIPAGTIIAGNQWAIHYDPAVYPDPQRFSPERFLGLDLTYGECSVHPDPMKRDHYAFGAGRRICPGLHLAENSLFILASRLLWAYDISSPIDPTTGKVKPNDTWAYPPSIVYAPLPYKANITVRSPEKAEMIATQWEEAERSWAESH